jgi:hypothetical protein
MPQSQHLTSDSWSLGSGPIVSRVLAPCAIDLCTPVDPCAHPAKHNGKRHEPEREAPPEARDPDSAHERVARGDADAPEGREVAHHDRRLPPEAAEDARERALGAVKD